MRSISLSSDRPTNQNPSKTCNNEESLHTASTTFSRASSSLSFSTQAFSQTENEYKMTKDALQITNAAIEAVNPSKAIQTHFKVEDSYIKILNRETGEYYAYDLDDFDHLYIAAFGKAAAVMALSTAQILSKSNVNMKGIVITKDDHATKGQIDELASHNISLHYASHPVPDERSVEHSKTLLKEINELANEKTFVINCVSGGGSSLFCTPANDLDLSHMAKLNQSLLSCGMPITEMNVLRKKVEIGKGGGLVRASHPAKCVAMVLSDVIGDPLDLIASGPSVKDTSTFADAVNLVERYDLVEGGKYALPKDMLHVLYKGRDDELESLNSDTCVDDEAEIFENSKTVLVGNNALAVAAAANQAKKLGYNPVVLGTTIEGESSDIAEMIVSMAAEVQLQRTNPSISCFPMTKLPAALIAGGETTVTLNSDSGKGGRNQEIGLAAALKMKSCNLRDIVLASIGTDGTDGPCDAAGAVVDGTTIDRVENEHNQMYKGEEALRKHDAYNFFDIMKEKGPLVKTGATGTNVADVCVTLIN